jgi:hypothetical protein
MNPDSRQIDGILDNYRNLVLRWNRRINLISRRDTANRLDKLIHQCRNSWTSLADSDTVGLAGASRLWYFDLGSGGGLPGVVWHVQMVAAKLPVRTFLVEPREKRAWFLERAARQVGSDSLHVLANRWEEPPKDGFGTPLLATHPSHVLISLKALKLSDATVLAGLSPFLEAGKTRNTAAENGPTILIARFHPPDQKWSKGLAGELGIPEAGHLRSTPSFLFRSEGGRVLAPGTLPGASLVLSEYRIQTP